MPTALLSHDPEAITDVGLLLLEEERVLYRPHKLYSADQILSVAAGMAVAKQAQPTLTRLQKVAKEQKLKLLAKALEASDEKTRGESSIQAVASKHQDDGLVEPFLYCVDRITLAKLLKDRRLLKDLKPWSNKNGKIAADVQEAFDMMLEEAEKEIPEDTAAGADGEEKSRQYGHFSNRFPNPVGSPDHFIPEYDETVTWTRCVWDQGAFVKQDNQWVEYYRGQQINTFRETGRNSNLVELYDPTRQMHLHIHADRILWKQPHTNWNLLYRNRVR